MKQLMVVAADLVAVSIMAFGLYFPRHHRRDLVTAFLGLNVCVVTVSLVMGAHAVGPGLGLSLFGVLSIIRLRSDAVAQHEVAYYFASLTIGLLAGVPAVLNPLTGGLMALVLAGLYVGDHPRLLRQYRQHTLRLDTAHTDSHALRGHLERLLGGRVVNVSVKELDLVNDTTLVDVRYVAGPGLAPQDQSRPADRAAS
jgi:hypothetical protein